MQDKPTRGLPDGGLSATMNTQAVAAVPAVSDVPPVDQTKLVESAKKFWSLLQADRRP